MGSSMASTDGLLPDSPGMYSLNLEKRMVEQRIDDSVVHPEAIKFIQIDVVAVYNPQQIPILFKVHHITGKEAMQQLGTFGLFPPDNPGTFVVATNGRLRANDTIKVAFSPLGTINHNLDIRVSIKRFSYIYEENMQLFNE
jgi:hypothetical protein